MRFQPDLNHLYNPRHPTPLPERIAIVTDAGRGAVNVAASGVKRDCRVGQASVLRVARTKSYAELERFIACDKREAFAQGSDLSAVSQRAKAEATKQSLLSFCCEMDCFAEPVIGRAFARPVGSQ